jgi:HNH endonuclease/AP2 domain
MADRELITAAYLHKLLSYNPESGVFTRRIGFGSSVKAGTVAGCPNSEGYLEIRIDGRLYKCARLAWLWMTGAWPVAEIDHINLDPGDNRFCNLREASRSQNKWNEGKRLSNTSGIKGVSWYRQNQKWRADIRINGEKKHLGFFATIDEAAAAYASAAAEHFGEFARLE